MKRVFCAAALFLLLSNLCPGAAALIGGGKEGTSVSPPPEKSLVETIPEYGSLRIDMSAAGDTGSFDVLVRIGGENSALPVPAGTQYLFLAAQADVWTLKKVESSGAISLADGEAAMFTKLTGGASFSVRETKNSLKNHDVTYCCNTLSTEGDYPFTLTDDGGIKALSGFIVPDSGADSSEIPPATVIVTITNTKT